MERSQLEENILLCLLFGPESIGDPVSPEFLHYLKVRWSKNNLSLCIKVEPLTADAWCGICTSISDFWALDMYPIAWQKPLHSLQPQQAPLFCREVKFILAECIRTASTFNHSMVTHSSANRGPSCISVLKGTGVSNLYCIEITYCPVQLLIILQHCHAGERRGYSTVLSMVV